MSKGYWVVRIDVTDPAKYAAYQAMVDVPLKKFGGRFLVRGGKFETKEGGARKRNVIVEFPSYQAAAECYRSPEYQAAVAQRRGGADFDFIVIEGYDGAQP
jgi:uncharacterized protein (DUF1330 family)